MNELNLKAIERLERRLEVVQEAIEAILVAGQGTTMQAGSVERAQLNTLMRYEQRLLSELSMRTRGGYSIPTRYKREWANLPGGNI